MRGSQTRVMCCSHVTRGVLLVHAKDEAVPLVGVAGEETRAGIEEGVVQVLSNQQLRQIVVGHEEERREGGWRLTDSWIVCSP